VVGPGRFARDGHGGPGRRHDSMGGELRHRDALRFETLLPTDRMLRN